MHLTRNRTDVIALIALLVVLVVHPACDLGMEDTSGPSDPCKLSQGHVDPGSSWSIEALSGKGSRTNCSDEAYSKSFEFKLSKPIPVSRTNEEVPQRFEGSIGNGFKLKDGEINGICVSFETEETLSEGDVVRRTFVGKFNQYHDIIKGDFTGLGPYHCDVHGTFRAVIGQ